MSDLVKEIMGKFIDLSQEEKVITAESDAAFKEYNDYCADSEKDLNEKIDEIHKKMEKLNYYLDYAREHATELEEAPEAFDTPDGTLESIRQTIKLDSTNDPNAETLYIKATGKKMFYEAEIERVRKLIEGSKVQAKRQLDSETAKLNNRKSEHFEKVRAYVLSNDFAEYLKILVYDKSAFNSPGTVPLGDDGFISLGQRRVKLFVPMDIEQDIAMSSNGEYNAAAHTIGAPYQVSTKKGGTLFLEHDERNGQYLLGGIQRLLLNFIKYFGNDITRCVFCDPDRYSVDSLGNIAALGKGLNPFITVPKSKEEIEGKVNRLATRAAEAPTPDKVSRILVLQSFPEKYSPELAAKVLDVCKNAEQNGVLVVLTHAVSSETSPVEAEIRAMAEVIRSRNGGFWIERERESLFWYSAPSDISDEVRKVYVEKRNQDALKAAQEPAVEAPEPAPKPVEPPKPEVKAEPAPKPVEPPKPEVKAEPAPKPVEPPKPEVKAEPAPKPVEPPKPEVKAEPAPKPAPAAARVAPKPKAEDREVIMTVLSEISDTLPPPALDPFEALNVGVQRQEIDPELTYRITDRQPAAPASPFASASPAAPVESTPIDPNAMTYKITDHPDKVASMNEEHPAPKTPERKTPIVQHQTAVREGYEVTPDMTYRITDKKPESAPTTPESPVQPTQLSSVISPEDMTYKITDFPDKVTSMINEHPNSRAGEEKVSLQTHQTAAREPIEVTEDMRYKITDFPDKVASMNAPKPTYTDPEDKPGAIKTVIDAGKNVIDAGKRKIEEITAKKNTDYPVRSLLDDEKLEIPADEISMDAPVQPTQLSSVISPEDMTYKITDFPDKVTSMNIEHPNSKAGEEKVSLQTHQTAAREPIEVTEDMRYKITDFPDKVASMNAPKPTYTDPEDKPGAIKTVIDAGKNVLDAGKRKIEEITAKKNTDYPVRSLLDDEKLEIPADEISMDAPVQPTQLSSVISPEDMTYKITDFPDKVTSMINEHPNSRAGEEKVSLQTHQTAAREPIEVTEDMRYKITDFPDKVASMNAPKPTYTDPEDKPGAIKTVIDAGKNVIDAGKRKIEEMTAKKNTDYPVRSLLDDEKLEIPADEISMDAPAQPTQLSSVISPEDMTYKITDFPDKVTSMNIEHPNSKAGEEKVSLQTHQTAAREPIEVTEDMRYKITDFPDKVASMNAPKPTYTDPEDKPGAIKTVIDAGKNVLDAGKNVIDAGKRKIEEMTAKKNTDYPIRSLLDDDEKLETPADQISMDSEPADEKPSQPAHQTAARETAEVTPDLTYKITDFPDKVASMNAPKPGSELSAKAPTVGENEDMTYRITDKLPVAEKQPAAVTIEPEPEPVEDVFGKGVRKLPAIPIGKSVNGRFTSLNVGGNITYICGNRGDDRKTISDRIITQITASTHPDDVELWLFDCGDGEFMKYADDPAAHIKYLVFDTGADSSTDFAEVVAAELDRRVETFAENGWSNVEDIPADVFMPRIMVAVNAFPRFAENIVGTTKYFGRNHNDKLSKLFKSCGGYGIHFLLIGDEFSDGGERPNCLEGVTIGCAIAVSGRDRGISSLFSDIKLYDNEVESLRKIPSGCAFVAEADSTQGLTLVRLGGENAKNEHTYSEVSAYSDSLEEYVGKNPFIGDRKAASRFDDRGDYRAEQIKNRDDGECLLFLGEPCRFMGEYPVRLFDDFGENLLTIAPAREKNSAALMVKAALRSLVEQGIVVEILACRSNPVYSELHRSGDLDGLEVFEGGKAEARIKELADMLDKGKRPDVFEIVLGGDLLMASMGASDMLPVLKRALVKGPRDGAHFMFISGSVAQTEPEFLSLFRHKLVFACPYNEAEKILRDPNCDLPENAFRLSNDYDELTILPYSM